MRKLIKRVAQVTGIALAVAALTGAEVVAGLATVGALANGEQHPVAGVAVPAHSMMLAPRYDVARPADYPSCDAWRGLRFGVITFTGASTHSYWGCINPNHPGVGDSFAGRIAGYLATADQPDNQ